MVLYINHFVSASVSKFATTMYDSMAYDNDNTEWLWQWWCQDDASYIVVFCMFFKSYQTFLFIDFFNRFDNHLDHNNVRRTTSGGDDSETTGSRD
jgi:hypothetical protein